MVRFLHTADWQLGRAFRQTQERADGLRQARIDVVKSIVGLARSRPVDFIVVAGDTFEDNRIDHRQVRDMAEVLRTSPVPVFLLPGNHDPLTQDSPYVAHGGLFTDPVVVLRRAEVIEAPGATLYPCPAFVRSWAGDPTQWIPERVSGDGIRVGVAHGPLDGTPDACGYHVSKTAADTHGLDYLALGHWHKPMGAGPRAWYSGTPEPTCFNEESGVVLRVEIDGPGAAPRVEQVRVATYDWQALDVEVHGEADLEHLERALARVEPASQTLLRVRLRGMLPMARLAAIDDVCARHQGRFYWLRLDNEVRPQADGSSWRHPLLRAVYERLATKAEVPVDPGSPEAEDAAAARRALSRLATLVADSGQPDLE